MTSVIVSGNDLPPDPGLPVPKRPTTDLRPSRPVTTDEFLVVGARVGDASALGALYDAHADSLFTLALRLSGSRADAEDALHDLFVGLPELLRRYDEHGRLDAWLKAVIARMVLTQRRTARRRDDLMQRAATSETVQLSTNPDWSTIDLDRAIAALPATLRAVFVLKQIEGYSHDNIAELLGITSGASRVRFTRAVRQLRLLLEPRK